VALTTRNLLQVADGVCLAQVEKLRDAMRRLTEQPDAEAVHDTRVSCRRLRVALGIARPLYRRRAVTCARDRLKRLLRLMGEPRDAEVLAQRVWKLSGRARPGAAPAGTRGHNQAWLGWLVETHATLQRLRATATAAEEFADLPAEIEHLLERPPRKSKHAERLLAAPLMDIARDALDEAMSDVEHMAHVAAESPAGQLHALRIAMKKLRYAGEFFLTGAPASDNATAHTAIEAIIATARHFQDVLGELHDAVVAEAHVSEWIRVGLPAPPQIPPPADIPAALADLLEAVSADQRHLRNEFGRRWSARVVEKLRREIAAARPG
jgi:CHAD domain-containing protein